MSKDKLPGADGQERTGDEHPVKERLTRGARQDQAETGGTDQKARPGNVASGKASAPAADSDHDSDAATGEGKEAGQAADNAQAGDNPQSGDGEKNDAAGLEVTSLLKPPPPMPSGEDDTRAKVDKVLSAGPSEPPAGSQPGQGLWKGPGRRRRNPVRQMEQNGLQDGSIPSDRLEAGRTDESQDDGSSVLMLTPEQEMPAPPDMRTAGAVGPLPKAGGERADDVPPSEARVSEAGTLASGDPKDGPAAVSTGEIRQNEGKDQEPDLGGERGAGTGQWPSGARIGMPRSEPLGAEHPGAERFEADPAPSGPENAPAPVESPNSDYSFGGHGPQDTGYAASRSGGLSSPDRAPGVPVEPRFPGEPRFLGEPGFPAEQYPDMTAPDTIAGSTADSRGTQMAEHTPPPTQDAPPAGSRTDSPSGSQSGEDGQDQPARKSSSGFRSLSDVAREVGVPQHVLRFWETRFKDIQPLKRGGGRRYYRPEDVALVRAIQSLVDDHGLSVPDVEFIFAHTGAAAVVQAERDGSLGSLVAVVVRPAAAGARGGTPQGGDPSLRGREGTQADEAGGGDHVPSPEYRPVMEGNPVPPGAMDNDLKDLMSPGTVKGQRSGGDTAGADIGAGDMSANDRARNGGAAGPWSDMGMMDGDLMDGDDEEGIQVPFSDLPLNLVKNESPYAAGPDLDEAQREKLAGVLEMLCNLKAEIAEFRHMRHRPDLMGDEVPGSSLPEAPEYGTKSADDGDSDEAGESDRGGAPLSVILPQVDRSVPD